MLDRAYRDARHRVTEVVAGLSVCQLRTSVPATPGWTVRELVAHVVGIAHEEIVRMPDSGTDDGTRRQVAERRDCGLSALLAEWEHVAPAVEMGLARVERGHWQPFLEVMMRSLRRRLRASSALLIHDEPGQQWNCGSGEVDTVLRADGYELLRATFSRRSRRQIAAWSWTPGPHAEAVERFGFFGPRDDDQPVGVS